MKWLFRFFSDQQKKAASDVAGIQLSDKARQLLSMVVKMPTASQEELATRLSWHRNTVLKYLKELRRAGLIRWQRRRRLPNSYELLDAQAHVNQASEGLFGRRAELQQLRRLVAEGRHILILGSEGMGKTTLLKAIFNVVPNLEKILLEQSSPAKSFLLHLAQELHRLGLLKDIHQLDRRRNGQLASAVIKALAGSGKKWLLFLDGFEPTPKQLPILEALMPYCQLVATARATKPSAAVFFSAFSRVELGPLDEGACKQIVDSYVVPNGIAAQNQELLKAKLIEASKGNPKLLIRLLEKFSHSGFVDNEAIEAELPKDREYFDLRPLVVLAFAGAIAIRYIGIGLEQEEIYVLGGIGTAFFLALRYFLLYRWKERKANP